VRVAAVGTVALVAAAVLEWSPLVPVSLALVGAAYATHLALDDPPLDVRVAALAALLLLAAELAYWSLEEVDDVSAEPGEAWRRLAVVVGFGAVALVVAAGVLALVDAVRARGLVVDLVGAAAAAAALLALVLFTRGHGRTSEQG
jgi:hypothetical protein